MGQILKSGKLVIHGDVGQTFLYGAKGGEIYVMGSAAGRPLINAVRQGAFGKTRPASTLVEVPRLAIEGAKVEIECVALVPS